MNQQAPNLENCTVALEAVKDGLRQGQGGVWKITFTVQGADMHPALAVAPMGTRYQVVLVEIDESEQPVPTMARASGAPLLQAPAPSNVARLEPKGGTFARQAGITCQEGAFRAFLAERGWPDLRCAEDAAGALRIMVGVNSRRELDTDPAKGRAWRSLKAEYDLWMRS